MSRNRKRIYNQETLITSWIEGSTMWIVHGDGLRMFSKDNFENIDKLFHALKHFIENRKQYEVYSN